MTSEKLSTIFWVNKGTISWNILPIIDNPNEEIKKMEDEQRKTREQADKSHFNVHFSEDKEMIDNYAQ